jgi:hypothetical protein
MVFFWAQIGFAGSIHENIPDSKYLELGSKYSSVVQLDINMGNNITAVGSGVIIDENWILTAAHGIVNSSKVVAHKDGISYESTKIVPHKDFDYDKGSYDIGLIKFNKKFNLNKYPELCKDDKLEGKQVIMCGYGTIKSANNPDLEKLDMKIRAGSNIIDKIEDHLYICSMSKENNTRHEYIISGGDSGGGLFIDNQLVGINSCCISTDGKTDGSYDDQSGHTRIVLFLDWIEENRKN